MRRARARLFERLFRQNEFAIKLGLDAIGTALQLHGDPHRRAHRALVAGTNGKGSVASLLAHLATRVGVRTGLFTSPHLVDFAERIRIDGHQLDDPTLLETLAHVVAAHGGAPGDGALCVEILEALGLPRDDRAVVVEPPAIDDDATTLTYFELATLAAAIAFAERDCQLAVYEVGLGGRLDATNALDPGLSIITTIGLDHCDVLGDTLEIIADEKAAIARPGRPTVVGSRVVTDHLFRSVVGLGADPVVIGRDFDVERPGPDDAPWSVVSTRSGRRVELPARAASWPAWRRDQVAMAVQAAWLLEDQGVLPTLSPGALTAAVDTWRWPGRLDTLDGDLIERFAGRRDVTVLLDGAHNPDGARALAALVAERAAPAVHLVTNCMRDKDVAAMFAAIEPIADRIDVVPISSNRALSPAVYCARVGLEPRRHAHDSLGDGLRASLTSAAPGALIVVTGSLYLVGEVYELLGATARLASLGAVDTST